MKIFRKLLGIVALLLGAASFHLWYVFGANQPHYSYPEYGQIYPMHANGWTVYLTWSQELQLYGLGILAFVCLAAAVVLDLRTPRPKAAPQQNPGRPDAGPEAS